MKTLEQMRLDPAIQAEADRICEAALKMPRPWFYLGSDAEWEAGCRQVVRNLVLLSHHDRTVAAAWALMVIDGLGKHFDGGAS